MFETMIPEAFANLLAAYTACFQARSYPTFSGWCWAGCSVWAVGR
jgi:hypothetical protein